MALLALFVLPDKIPCFVAHLGRQICFPSASYPVSIQFETARLDTCVIAITKYCRYGVLEIQKGSTSDPKIFRTNSFKKYEMQACNKYEVSEFRRFC